MKIKNHFSCLILIILLLMMVSNVYSSDIVSKNENGNENEKKEMKKEENKEEEESLTKEAQNPVSNMISLPIQNNTYFNVGPHKRTMNLLNIQPVIPIQVSKDLNLINRIIIPVESLPIDENARKDGIGDISYQAYFTSTNPGKFIWGAGPIINIPTASDKYLGTGKWSIGPTACGLFMTGPWVYGALANNVWSVGGDKSRPNVNQFLVQPFINYNLPNNWYIGTSPAITADWTKNGDERWIVPLGGGIGKLFDIGNQPINFSVHAYKNVIKPEYGPDWQLRVQLQFLFSSGK